MASDTKQFPLRLTDHEDALLTATAAKHGLSKQAYAKRAINSVLLQDQALDVAADGLEKYGAAFGLDPEGNAAKAAVLRAGDRLTP